MKILAECLGIVIGSCIYADIFRDGWARGIEHGYFMAAGYFAYWVTHKDSAKANV